MEFDIQDFIFFEMVRSYLNGRVSIEELDRWIVERLPSFVPPRQDAVSALAGSIQLWVAEMNAGHRSPDEVRAMVREHLERQGPVIVSADVDVRSGSASANVVAPLFMGSAGAQVWSVSRI